MPFYEYECQACKFYTEVMQKIADAPLIKCPSCGKRALKKLVSAPVFRLKGGGWYETDFKSDKENKRNLVGAEKEEAKPEGKSEAAADKTPAAESKETKSPDTKSGETKAGAKDEGTRPTPKRTTLSGKTARRAKPKRTAKPKRGRRRRQP